jgi:hypothetical protein
VNEVENKLKEKIEPLNAEINSIKNNFNGLYDEEINDFKQLNILNQCHNNILNINDNVNIMKENMDKYDNEIKGFNISDNKLKFLNKLNKDLQEFIDGLNNDKDMMMDLDTDEENTKIDSEVKKMNNINQELNIVFYDTLSLLKDISKDEKKDNMNYDDDILNNLKKVINNLQNKLNFEKTFKDDAINNNIDSDCKYNPLDSIPNFFE